VSPKLKYALPTSAAMYRSSHAAIAPSWHDWASASRSASAPSPVGCNVGGGITTPTTVVVVVPTVVDVVVDPGATVVVVVPGSAGVVDVVDIAGTVEADSVVVVVTAGSVVPGAAVDGGFDGDCVVVVASTPSPSIVGGASVADDGSVGSAPGATVAVSPP
jgi:hypothetical protein